METDKTTDVRRLFDRWAGQGRGDTMAKGHWPAVAQIIEKMHLEPGQQCLDVGCGNGYAVRAMAERVLPDGTVVGVDLSPEMLSMAASATSLPNVCYEQASAERLPFEEGRFDHLLSVEAIYYMPDPRQALQEWRRVLKPGGRVWVMTDFYRENSYSLCWPGLLELPLHLFSEHEYRDLFRHQGFTGVSTQRLFNPTPVARETFTPGWGYETPEDVIDFRTRVGSLLVTGLKV